MKHTRIEIYENGTKCTFDCGYSVSGVPDKLGALVEVVEGIRECARYTFLKSWDKETDLNREYLLLMNPDLKNLIDGGDLTDVEIPNLYRAANRKLAQMGYTHTCPRCGGTGHHSFNQRDGTICWGCRGAGRVLDKLTKKLLKEIRARI